MRRENPMKARLAAGKRNLGCWLVSSSNMAAEVVSRAGYDFVIVDHEHGPGNLTDLIGQMQGLAAGGGADGGPAVFVRVPWNDPVYIKRALDCGAEGIMVPYVETAEEAQAAAQACRYPPDGNRGCAFGAIRASNFGGFAADYWRKANGETLVMLQIETPAGVANAAEIAAVPGVDILFIGPNDLTVTSGFDPVNMGVDAVANVDAAFDACKATGMPVAAVPYAGRSAREMFEHGFDMVAAGSELSLLRRAAETAVAAHREQGGA